MLFFTLNDYNAINMVSSRIEDFSDNDLIYYTPTNCIVYNSLSSDQYPIYRGKLIDKVEIFDKGLVTRTRVFKKGCLDQIIIDY